MIARFVTVFCVLTIALSGCQRPDEALVWTSIHVSGERKSGDAHLLRFPNGSHVLIDTGYQEYAESALLPTLERLGVQQLEAVLITHAHKNHYGGILTLAQKMPISKIYFNPPDTRICAKESKRKRCDYAHVLDTISALKALTTVEQVATGDVLLSQNDHDIEWVVIHHSNSPDVSYLRELEDKHRFTVNDSSVTTRLRFGGTSVLFPGDTGSFLGEYLSQNQPESLKSTLLAAPHHGVNDMPNDHYFDVVSPEQIIVSISPPPFVGQRGQAIRRYAKRQGIPVYVTGFEGDITVNIRADGYTVTPSNLPPTNIEP